jgi:hypothetical protein
MPLPEEITSIYGDLSLASEALDRALRRGSSTFRPDDVVDELAIQMGFALDRLSDAAHDVLWGLLRALDANFENEGPWNWLADIEARRHFRIAEAVIEHLTIDELVLAADELGWRRRKVEVSDFSDVAKGIREAFSSLLADRVRKLLDGWRKDNVWNHVMVVESRLDRMARERGEDEKRTLPPST